MSPRIDQDAAAGADTANNEGLAQPGVAVGQRCFKPRPVRSLRALEQIQQAIGEFGANHGDGAVALKRAQVFFDSEKDEGPGPRTREARDHWYRRMEEVACETVPAGITRAPNDRAK